MNGNEKLFWAELLKNLSGKKIVVTGASGFLGTRLIQILSTNKNISIIPVINRYHAAVRLARIPLAFIKTNLLNIEEVIALTQGADYVFHLAYSSSGDENFQKQFTINSAKNIMEACLINKVQKVIHISTMSVYGIRTNGILTENLPNVKSNFSYSDAKIEAEKIVMEYYKKGLSVSIIQPTIIYGPYSGSWTNSILNGLKIQDFYIPAGGGICNPVYVDDVVQSIILAATNPNSTGERYLISSNEQITWEEYYGYYEKMLNVKALKVLPYDDIKKISLSYTKKRGLFDLFKYVFARERTINIAKQIKLLRAIFIIVRIFVSEEKWLQIKKIYFPQPQSNNIRKATVYPMFFYDILHAKPEVNIEKAKKQLNYNPRYSIKQGIEITHNWAKWANLAP